jgi:monoamine oxidase
MSSWKESEKLMVALETLSSLTQKPLRFLQNELEACYHHDWSQDPFSKGAYSYIRYNGVQKSRQLCKAFDGKIYFAGEATAPGAARGTIHGAWNSGLRAAHQILGKSHSNRPA